MGFQRRNAGCRRGHSGGSPGILQREECAMISNFDRAKAYISKMDAAIEGHGGDDQTFLVACKLVAFGLSGGEAESLLREYNTRCVPPWSEHDLHRKLKNAFRIASP